MESGNDTELQKSWELSQDDIKDQDRISSLPDDIMFHVLSLLEMKDVVKTGVLSRRWGHLWTNVRTLDFRGPTSCEEEAREKFVSFVDYTLLFNESKTIKTFHLLLGLTEAFPEDISEEEAKRVKELCLHIDRWVRLAVRKKVEIVYLDFFTVNTRWRGCLLSLYPYNLPCSLYINNTIKSLLLASCSIDPTRQLQWKYLKVLRLFDVKLCEELVETILNGSPLLESLHLLRCNGLRKLSIKSPNLEYLLLFFSVEGLRLDIQAPYLKVLECMGEIANYRLIDVSSLVYAIVRTHRITCNVSYQTIVTSFLTSVRRAECLAVCTRFLEMVSLLEIESLPTPSTDCNYLELKANLTKWELPGILALLRSSSNLNTLTIKKGDRDGSIEFRDEYLKGYDLNEANYWSIMLASTCLMEKLKSVIIYEFDGGSSEIALVEFLLMKAPILDKMVIYSKKEKHSSEDRTPSASNDKSTLYEKLLSFERASPNGNFLFF
ncbi:hypothetical protein IFM89_015186 [Coptis chinensis]|uniref:F-box domain-containing protein n=1 Tax=Coptis chinensis TaxID=261450 RepID=A0A835HBU9_9MAGN|nr:hypothetical protein IFM89_015186 [Coptis chinensis]